MTSPTSSLIGLLFLKHNSRKLDKSQWNLKFFYFSMQLKNEEWSYSNVIEPRLSQVETSVQTGTKTRIWFRSQICTDNGAKCIIPPSTNWETCEYLLIGPVLSLPQNNKRRDKTAISWIIHIHWKKATHILKFSILTPEQTKHIRSFITVSVRQLSNDNHDGDIHYFIKFLKTPITDVVNSLQRHKIKARKANTRPSRYVLSIN